MRVETNHATKTAATAAAATAPVVFNVDSYLRILLRGRNYPLCLHNADSIMSNFTKPRFEAHGAKGAILLERIDDAVRNDPRKSYGGYIVLVKHLEHDCT